MKNKAKLTFEMLIKEMQQVEGNEAIQIKGGITLSQLSNIVSAMNANGVTHLTSSDLEAQGTSFEALSEPNSSFNLLIGGNIVHFGPTLTTTIPSRQLTAMELEMALNQDDPRWRVTIGKLTASGISQHTNLSINPLGWLYEGTGIQVYTADFQGDVGFHINDKGQWVASAAYQVVPPNNFTNSEASGNVGIYINNELYSTFSVGQKYYPNGTIGVPGVLYISGSVNLPSWFNGTQTVEFRASVGVTSHEGTNLTGNVNASNSTTLSIAGYGVN
jgi:hypothetical protein